MLNCELAGLGGNCEFLKAQSFFSWHRKFLFGTLNLGLQSGFVAPLHTIARNFGEGATRHFSDQQTRINDRLQIGGRLIARGYQYGKIGDKDEGDYLNGDLMYCAGASFSFPVGRTGLFGHLFASAGNVKIRGEDALKEDLSTLVSESRTTMGASLVIPMPIGRLEFGMALPFGRKEALDPFSNLFWGFDINF